jgi:hypothetical protein
MVGTLLLRGMVVGLIAGFLAFGVAKIFGEPQVDRAIGFEEQMAHQARIAHHEPDAPEPELVSRSTQSGLGLFTGVMTYSAAMGGLFALVFAFAYGRLGALRARAVSGLLAVGAFISIVLVPDLKYPANPPSIGNPGTIGSRTALYFIMIVISIAALVGAVVLARRLTARFGGWNAAVQAGLAYVAVIVIAQYALPAVNEVPLAFSAVVLWKFRVAALGIQIVLWMTLGLLFGALTERALEPPERLPYGARTATR